MSSIMVAGCRYKALLAVVVELAADAAAAPTGVVLDVADANPPAVVATFCCHGDEPPDDGAGGGRVAAAAAGLENVGLALRPSSANMSSDRVADEGAGGGGTA
jgi:hypothetical protein